MYTPVNTDCCIALGQHTPRQWDTHRLSWLPEASDNPASGICIYMKIVPPLTAGAIQLPMYPGPPTNFGLRKAIEEKWRKIQELETHGDYHSTYSTTFR